MLRVLTPATSSDLTTLAIVKRELGISDTSQDARLADLITTASNLVAQYCNRDTFGIETVEQTEWLHGTANALVLVRDLAPSITSVAENGTVLDPTAYHRDGSVLYRLADANTEQAWSYGGDWTSGLGSPLWYHTFGGTVTVTYTSGFSLPAGIPKAIERACLDVVFSLWNGSTRDQTIRVEQVEGVGQVQYAMTGPAALPIAPDRLAALDRWKFRAGF